jgi:hypothetical protein
MRKIPLLAILLCTLMPTGCGVDNSTVATSGTQAYPKEQLALIHVYKHRSIHEWKGHAVHIDRFAVGNIEYPVPAEMRDFLVSPGEHTIRVEYDICVHGMKALPAIEEGGIYSPPYGEFKAHIEPGGEYNLVASEQLTGANGIQTIHTLVPVTKVPVVVPAQK